MKECWNWIEFVFEIGVFYLVTSLPNHLIENIIYHVGTLDIVFFKTKFFSHCKCEKNQFSIQKILFSMLLLLEHMIFVSHFLLQAVVIEMFYILFRRQPVTYTLPPAVFSFCIPHWAGNFFYCLLSNCNQLTLT